MTHSGDSADELLRSMCLKADSRASIYRDMESYHEGLSVSVISVKESKHSTAPATRAEPLSRYVRWTLGEILIICSIIKSLHILRQIYLHSMHSK
jgi:hypothetical protein